MSSNAKFIKSQFMAKHSTTAPIKLQRLGECLYAMCGVREIQCVMVLTSKIQKISAK